MGQAARPSILLRQGILPMLLVLTLILELISSITCAGYLKNHHHQCRSVAQPRRRRFMLGRTLALLDMAAVVETTTGAHRLLLGHHKPMVPVPLLPSATALLASKQ